MSKLYLYYGAMGSAKSLDLLRTAYNYVEGGKKVLLMTSSVDDRAGVGVIESRVGISEKAYPIQPNQSVFDDFDEIWSEMSEFNEKTEKNDQKSAKLSDICSFSTELKHPDVVLVDEGQFLTLKTVQSLVNVADLHGIPVIVYALKNDFMNNLFEGSEALLIYADSIKEIKSICRLCASKATMNLKVKDGHPVYHDRQTIEIGGNELYVPVCRKHYYKYEIAEGGM